MKGLLEDKHVDLELEQVVDTEGEIELVLNREAEMRDLAARCRELLARLPLPADGPPGHWLG